VETFLRGHLKAHNHQSVMVRAARFLLAREMICRIAACLLPAKDIRLLSLGLEQFNAAAYELRRAVPSGRCVVATLPPPCTPGVEGSTLCKVE
jgi:hypothetical protein